MNLIQAEAKSVTEKADSTYKNMKIQIADFSRMLKFEQQKRKDELDDFIASMQIQQKLASSTSKKMITDLSDSQQMFKAEQKKRKDRFSGLIDASSAAFKDKQEKRKLAFESVNKDFTKQITQKVKSVEKVQKMYTEVLALRKAFKKN